MALATVWSGDSRRRFGGIHPRLLQVVQRRLPGFAGEAAQHRAGADVERPGESGEVVELGEPLHEPPFGWLRRRAGAGFEERA
jgi:hypothetical protein